MRGRGFTAKPSIICSCFEGRKGGFRSRNNHIITKSPPQRDYCKSPITNIEVLYFKKQSPPMLWSNSLIKTSSFPTLIACLETVNKESNSLQAAVCVQALITAYICKLLVILHLQHWVSQEVDECIKLRASISQDASYFDLLPLAII